MIRHAILISIALSGCATLGPQPGQPNARDVVCNPVGRHQVRIRRVWTWPVPLLECKEARERVRTAVADWDSDRVFIFSPGEAAVTVEHDNFTGESTPTFAGSATFGNRVIQVRFSDLGEGALEHEVQHATGRNVVDSFAGREWY